MKGVRRTIVSAVKFCVAGLNGLSNVFFFIVCICVIVSFPDLSNRKKLNHHAKQNRIELHGKLRDGLSMEHGYLILTHDILQCIMNKIKKGEATMFYYYHFFEINNDNQSADAMANHISRLTLLCFF